MKHKFVYSSRSSLFPYPVFRNERTRFNTPNSAKRSGSANPMGKSYCHTCLSGRHKNSIGRKSSRALRKTIPSGNTSAGVRQAFSDKVSSNATDEVIGQAQEILALKREIILANPLLDMDKIISGPLPFGKQGP